jgi:hypothetical protein
MMGNPSKKLHHVLFRVFLFLILFGGFVRAEPGETEQSGNYQELMLAIDPKSGTLTGYYENGTGWDPEIQGPRFSCIFYVYGKKVGDQYKIQTWFPGEKNPEVITGELRFLPREKGTEFPTLLLRLDQEHGGCWNVNPDLAKPEGSQLSLQNAAPWIEVRVVQANRAHFFQKPDIAPTKAYVVRGDGLGILEKKPGWVRAVYRGKTTGWVKETDIFPSLPPKGGN